MRFLQKAMEVCRNMALIVRKKSHGMKNDRNSSEVSDESINREDDNTK